MALKKIKNLLPNGICKRRLVNQKLLVTNLISSRNGFQGRLGLMISLYFQEKKYLSQLKVGRKNAKMQCRGKKCIQYSFKMAEAILTRMLQRSLKSFLTRLIPR